jgi:hypothetical protein
MYLTGEVELGEDGLAGLERLVDVLVRHPDGMRPDLNEFHPARRKWMESITKSLFAEIEREGG